MKELLLGIRVLGFRGVGFRVWVSDSGARD